MQHSLLNRRSFCALGLLSIAAAKTSFARQAIDRAVDVSASMPLPPAILAAPTHEDRAAYEAFKAHFIAADGRVVDTFNGGVSHSESQGWGMSMAVAFDDPKTFDSIHHWTQTHLRRPSDCLHAWRFEPGRAQPVADINNATDGDLYIAGALARGARAWNRPDLAAEAGAIAQDVLEILVRRVGEKVVLLPGATGFDNDGIIVNLSYYAFSHINELAAVYPSPLWGALQVDGVRLIEEALCGSESLPPDWLHLDAVTGALRPAPQWPARFGYDAIRIPLNLVWAGLRTPRLSAALQRYVENSRPHLPAWIDLSDGSYAPYPAERGTHAVIEASLPDNRSNGRVAGPRVSQTVSAVEGYYSSALVVLARIAIKDQWDLLS